MIKIERGDMPDTERREITGDLSNGTIYARLMIRWDEIYSTYEQEVPEETIGYVFDLVTASDLTYGELKILRNKTIITSDQFDELVSPYETSANRRVRALLPGLRQ